MAISAGSCPWLEIAVRCVTLHFTSWSSGDRVASIRTYSTSRASRRTGILSSAYAKSIQIGRSSRLALRRWLTHKYVVAGRQPCVSTEMDIPQGACLILRLQ